MSKTVNVLCFGNSLTSGYCSFGMNEHPYSKRLQQRLSAALPPGVTSVKVHTNGLPGDMVCNRPFQTRLLAELQQRKYDWVIMLAGTNDLGRAMSPDKITEALHDRWDDVIRSGAKLVAMTIPECAVKVSWLGERRAIVNDEILNYKDAAEGTYHAFDLCSAVPYHDLSEEDRKLYWDDGLHFTPEGYDWMGDHIADFFVPLLTETEEK